MELEPLGNVGYQVGAVGIVAITIVYFTIVRWWTDHLGRVLAAVLGTISLVLIMSVLRMLKVDLPGDFFVWRATVFWLFGIAVWIGLGTMVWAQFLAPRVTRKKLTTPPRRNHEEVGMAAHRPDRDGGPDDRPGSGR